MESAKAKEIVKNILNDDKVFNVLYNLKHRWADEKEYEDWSYYQKVMHESLESYGINFIKGYKRPFGFSMLVDGNQKVKVSIKKNKKNEFWLVGNFMK